MLVRLAAASADYIYIDCYHLGLLRMAAAFTQGHLNTRHAKLGQGSAK